MLDLEHTSMKDEINKRKVMDKIRSATQINPDNIKEKEKIVDILFKKVCADKYISLDQLSMYLVIDHGILMDPLYMHHLLHSHPKAVETKKRIDESNIVCPKCGSNERHYPLTLDVANITCFICGEEYNMNTGRMI